MELLNALTNEDQIKKLILGKGYCAEHNYYNYIYNCDSSEEPIFFKMSESEGILTFYHAKTSSYRLYSSIIAKSESRLNCLIAFLDYVTSHGTKKVEIETDLEFRNEILLNFKKNKNYTARKVLVTFTWPVFNMKDWNGNLMQGKDWKDMRNYWNKYFREHKVEFKTASDFDKSQLIELVMKWKKQRTGSRQTFYKCYLNAINNDFKGFKTRIMVVDGVVSAITAGFVTPKSGYYYSSIGLYLRDVERTGEICNMDDLMELKKDGYEFVDFGGGEETLTTFKKKFHPTSYYNTYVFSIVKNKC